MDSVQGGTSPGSALLVGLPEDLEGWLVFSPDLKELAADAATLAPAEALRLIAQDWQLRWAKGYAPPAEVYLELCQDWCQSELAWQLVLIELELAAASGYELTLDAYLARLPEWSPELEQWFQRRVSAAHDRSVLPVPSAAPPRAVDETVRVAGQEKTLRAESKAAAAMVLPTPAAAGELLAGYRILEQLHSEVGIERYRALDLERRLEVELTLPSRPCPAASERRKRLELGLEICQDLQANGGIAPHFSGWYGDRPYVAVECTIGNSLDAPGRWRQEAANRAVGWTAQLAKTLGVLHRRGIECVAPSTATVWIDEQQQALLSPAALFSRETADVAAARPSPWRAPECSAAGRFSPRSDVYALGALLQFLLTGQVPSPAGERRSSASPADIAEPWRTVCQRAMAIDSKARYANADDLATELEAHANHPQMLTSVLVPGLVCLAIVVAVASLGWLWNTGWLGL